MDEGGWVWMRGKWVWMKGGWVWMKGVGGLFKNRQIESD